MSKTAKFVNNQSYKNDEIESLKNTISYIVDHSKIPEEYKETIKEKTYSYFIGAIIHESGIHKHKRECNTGYNYVHVKQVETIQQSSITYTQKSTAPVNTTTEISKPTILPKQLITPTEIVQKPNEYKPQNPTFTYDYSYQYPQIQIDKHSKKGYASWYEQNTLKSLELDFTTTFAKLANIIKMKKI